MWQMPSMPNGGLVGSRRAGGPAGDALVPDLARALPAPGNGGLPYTFHLRPGIRYSTGALVRPEDFRHAIERVFRLNYLGGGAGFYAGIVSGGQCERPPRPCALAPALPPTDQATTI